VVSGLTGCGHTDIIRPEVDLYHDLQGGVIATQRPPPPGVNAPYPNLGTVPKRPAAADIAAEQRIADQLATQRDAAVAAAAANPIKVPTAPAIPKPAPPDPDANHVTVDAAPTPPAVPAPPPAVSAFDSVPAVPTAVASGPLPALAGAPPAGPAGLGPLFTPPAAAADGRTSAPAPAAPVVASAASGTVVSVVFSPGSATLPPSATLNLRRFALAHKGVPVTITGHGDATLPGADAQSRALDLALRRAAAMAVPLAAAGVSAANLRLHAEAAGQGGTASL
jgi:outer membrane protein OmpA-like peptidoglycan-associated protein